MLNICDEYFCGHTCESLNFSKKVGFASIHWMFLPKFPCSLFLFGLFTLHQMINFFDPEKSVFGLSEQFFEHEHTGRSISFMFNNLTENRTWKFKKSRETKKTITFIILHEETTFLGRGTLSVLKSRFSKLFYLLFEMLNFS